MRLWNWEFDIGILKLVMWNWEFEIGRIQLSSVRWFTGKIVMFACLDWDSSRFFWEIFSPGFLGYQITWRHHMSSDDWKR